MKRDLDYSYIKIIFFSKILIVKFNEKRLLKLFNKISISFEIKFNYPCFTRKFKYTVK